MRPIIIQRHHSLGLAGARRLLETTAERLREEHGGAVQWNGDPLRSRATGAPGHVAATNDQVEGRVVLGLLLPPWRARIAGEIAAFFDGRRGAAVTPDRGQPARRAAPPRAPTRSSRSQGMSR